MKSTKVKIVSFSQGISHLEGRQNFANGTSQGGATAAESIEVTGPGVLVGYRGRSFLVPWSQVQCCEMAPEPTEEPKKGAKS